jgi:hypothetical protein
MTDTKPYISQHEHRVELVAKALMEHSELDHATAVALALHVLEALDHIPEKMR